MTQDLFDEPGQATFCTDSKGISDQAKFPFSSVGGLLFIAKTVHLKTSMTGWRRPRDATVDERETVVDWTPHPLFFVVLRCDVIGKDRVSDRKSRQLRLASQVNNPRGGR
jgi:hypothetical protein